MAIAGTVCLWGIILPRLPRRASPPAVASLTQWPGHLTTPEQHQQHLRNSPLFLNSYSGSLCASHLHLATLAPGFLFNHVQSPSIYLKAWEHHGRDHSLWVFVLMEFVFHISPLLAAWTWASFNSRFSFKFQFLICLQEEISYMLHGMGYRDQCPMIAKAANGMTIFPVGWTPI